MANFDIRIIFKFTMITPKSEWVTHTSCNKMLYLNQVDQTFLYWNMCLDHTCKGGQEKREIMGIEILNEKNI